MPLRRAFACTTPDTSELTTFSRYTHSLTHSLTHTYLQSLILSQTQGTTSYTYAHSDLRNTITHCMHSVINSPTQSHTHSLTHSLSPVPARPLWHLPPPPGPGTPHSARTSRSPFATAYYSRAPPATPHSHSNSGPLQQQPNGQTSWAALHTGGQEGRGVSGCVSYERVSESVCE